MGNYSPAPTQFHLSPGHSSQGSQPAQCSWGNQRWPISHLAPCLRRLVCCAELLLTSCFVTDFLASRLIVFRPVSTGNLVRTRPLAHPSCDWGMFASTSWKPSNHSLLKIPHILIEPLSPTWGWCNMVTLWYYSQNKQKTPSPKTLKQGTLSPKPLKKKKESRWGGLLTSVWGRSPTYVSKGRQTDIHPGDKLFYTCIWHQINGSFNLAPCLWKWAVPGSLLADFITSFYGGILWTVKVLKA